MTHVTCRLTAKNRDQLRNPTLGNRVWATFLRVSPLIPTHYHSSTAVLLLDDEINWSRLDVRARLVRRLLQGKSSTIDDRYHSHYIALSRGGGAEFCDHRVWLYTVSQKKQDTWLLPITSRNIYRFSKFFHVELSRKFVTKWCINTPTTP